MQAIHLIRAVSTLLNFSSDEERLLRETLDYKMSWFGKVARVKPLSSNPNSWYLQPNLSTYTYIQRNSSTL